MKALLLTTLLILAVQVPMRAQVPGQPYPIPGSQEPAEELPKFDIEFPGGYPAELVGAIQRSLDRVDRELFINVIIPPEFDEVMLPALKMRNVDVAQLFKALEFSSQRQVNTPSHGLPGFQPQYRQTTTRYGFRTAGPISPRTIWYFYAEQPAESEPVSLVRYYQLARYLTEFTMDDIASALDAGWKMLGETNTPKLNFHADTKLLIAVGTPQHLEMINSMLKELGAGMANKQSVTNAQPAKPAEHAHE